MVLDSNVDPGKVWYQANLDQDVDFDRVINIWFGWVARYDEVYHLGDTRAEVRRLWYAICEPFPQPVPNAAAATTAAAGSGVTTRLRQMLARR
jgi:hypothetical protein